MPTTRLLTEPKQIANYRSVLAKMLTYVKRRPFNPSDSDILDPVRLKLLLSTITPDDVYKYFCFKAFNKENPGVDDTATLRATTIDYWKKSLSFFWDTEDEWDKTNNTGNPMKGSVLTQLVKEIYRKEAKDEGKRSRRDRPFTRTEVEDMMKILENSTDFRWKYKIPTIIRLQIHLIGRVDDICQLRLQGLAANDEFDFTLLARVRWSKNVTVINQAPNQILLGAMNRKYCVLLSLALYFEACVLENTRIVNLFSHAGTAADADLSTATSSHSELLQKDAFRIKRDII